MFGWNCVSAPYPKKFAKMQLLNKVSEIPHKFVSLLFLKR